MEEVCDAIAAFWTWQTDNFDSQGAKMRTNQAKMIKMSTSIRKVVVKNNITFWTKTKEELDLYIASMSESNDSFSFSFVTESRRSTLISQYFTPSDLDHIICGLTHIGKFDKVWPVLVEH